MAGGPEIGSRIDEEVPQVGQNARMGRMSTLIVALAVAAAVVGCARGLPTLDRLEPAPMHVPPTVLLPPADTFSPPVTPALRGGVEPFSR